MPKRGYTKKNLEYWNALSGKPSPAQAAVATAPYPNPVPFPEIAYGSHEARGSTGATDGSVAIRDRALLSGGTDTGNFQALRALPLPYSGGGTGNRGSGYTGVSEAVELCLRAWVGIPIVKNAIEVSVEFSNQPLYVKCPNETVRAFFESWLKIIQIDLLKEYYFREYYRSGNVFLYRFDGKMGVNYYGAFTKAFGAKSNSIPVRYELLNPANVFVPAGLSYPHTYARLLSTWECERLRNGQTEQDRAVFKDLPEEVQRQLKMGGGNIQGVYLPLDPKRLTTSFYKKQSYEPLAVPFAWPVLPSVEWKLMLTKMDMALSRTIEHAILLVTTGEAANQFNGGNGINPNNIARLQKLFGNHAVGRVLVADYTTKAQWLIPEIQEILGPEKYEIVNEDIREGLQSILTGSDKFANAQIKAQIFIQRLEEGQNRFLNDFLLPEVWKICENMGFRNMPEIGFQKISLQDQSVSNRIYAQLGQLGILTPEQVVKAIETQILPDSAEMKKGQEEFKQARDKGYYQPIAPQQQGEEGGRPGGTSGIKQSGTRSSSPIGTSKASLEDLPAKSDAFSMKAIAERLRESQAVETEVEKALRKKHGVKGPFTEGQQAVARTLIRNIIATTAPGKWTQAVAKAVKSPPAIPAEVGREMDDICIEYGVDQFEAAILRHCKTKAPGKR